MHIKHFYHYSKHFKSCFSRNDLFAFSLFFFFWLKPLKEKCLSQKYFCKIKVTSAMHIPDSLEAAFCVAIPWIPALKLTVSGKNEQ